MCMYDLSPKESQRVHINRAGKKAVQNWQYRFKKQIPRLEKDGFIPVMGDEAFFIHDTVSGRKYWSPRGKRIAVPYTGSHKKVTVYGAIAKDGKQFFRTYDRFDAPTFIEYLKAMQRHFGKVVAVVDRASPHRGGVVTLAGTQLFMDLVSSYDDMLGTNSPSFALGFGGGVISLIRDSFGVLFLAWAFVLFVKATRISHGFGTGKAAGVLALAVVTTYALVNFVGFLASGIEF